jgi:hypothetical protein
MTTSFLFPSPVSTSRTLAFVNVPVSVKTLQTLYQISRHAIANLQIALHLYCGQSLIREERLFYCQAERYDCFTRQLF